MLAYVWPLLIYWLVFFVACYSVVELAQDQLYDEVTPKVGLKVAGGSLILAALATWLRPSFDTLFTTDVMWTVLQAIVWFAVFTLIFQFHPPHALALSLVTMVLISGLATLGVDSLTKPSRPIAAEQRRSNEPVRKSLTPVAPAAKDAAPAK
jgi:hypothetical protein